MHQRQGFTIVEVVFSAAVFATLLMTVLMTTFSVGQSTFMTGEAYLQSQQSARAALEVIEQDLASAKIRSYSNINDGVGNGKVYVKFQRMDPALINTNSQNANYQFPKWLPESQMRMYIWCSGNYLSAAPCAFITPKPKSDQLLLVKADLSSNTLGENRYNWVWEDTRNPIIISQGLVGFSAVLYDANNNPIVEGTNPTMCGSLSPLAVSWAGEGCVNKPGSPFNLPTPITLNQPRHLYLHVTIQTRGTVNGRTVVLPPVRARIALRNRQDEP